MSWSRLSYTTASRPGRAGGTAPERRPSSRLWRGRGGSTGATASVGEAGAAVRGLRPQEGRRYGGYGLGRSGRGGGTGAAASVCSQGTFPSFWSDLALLILFI